MRTQLLHKSELNRLPRGVPNAIVLLARLYGGFVDQSRCRYLEGAEIPDIRRFVPDADKTIYEQQPPVHDETDMAHPVATPG